MTLRERAARAAYRITSNNCLVPFAEQGDLTRSESYAVADAVLGELTKPPSEAMTLEGLLVLRGDGTISGKGAAPKGTAPYDPTGWYRRMVLAIFEGMVRAGIAEVKPPPQLTPAPACTKMIECCLGEGHAGSCCDIPF